MGQYRQCLTIATMYDRAVLDVKNRGFSTTSAIEQVAEFFGVTPSKIKQSIYYGEERGNREAVYSRYLDHLTCEEQYVTRKLAAVRARINEVRQS